MVTKMDRIPPQSVRDLPNLHRVCPFDLDRLLSYIDPGPAEEAEAYVNPIYEQRIDVSSEPTTRQVVDTDVASFCRGISLQSA